VLEDLGTSNIRVPALSRWTLQHEQMIRLDAVYDKPQRHTNPVLAEHTIPGVYCISRPRPDTIPSVFLDGSRIDVDFDDGVITGSGNSAWMPLYHKLTGILTDGLTKSWSRPKAGTQRCKR
jgi:hypothetical protein